MKLKIKTIIFCLLIIIFNLFSFNYLYSSELKECSIDNFDYNSKYILPKKIEVTTPNSNLWYKKILRSSFSINGRIVKKYKTYQKAKIKIIYNENLICNYSGKIRIHGGGLSHVDRDLKISSIRVKLKNGHVNNIYEFALIMKNHENIKTLQKDEANYESIFASTLFRELNFLSPLTFNTQVAINSKEFYNYSFVEMPSIEMSKRHMRNNGVFLSGNKNNFSSEENLGKSPRTIILGRIKDSSGISDYNKSVLLSSLDKLNFLYLNSLGIGNGANCCEGYEDGINLRKLYYNKKFILLNLENNKNKKELAKISKYNLLMNSLKGDHGFNLEDRIFFYNPTFDKLEPVLNQIESNILKNDKDLEIFTFEYEKEYIKPLIQDIRNINRKKFKNELAKLGLIINNEKLELIFSNIINNLKILSQSKLLKSFNPIYTKDYFNNHYDKSLSFNLVFGKSYADFFEICNIKLTTCEKIKIKSETISKLINDKFIDIDGYKNKSLFVRSSKNNYLNNHYKNKNGIKGFNKKNINNNLILHFNTDENQIKILKDVVMIQQKNEKDRFVFEGNSDQKLNIKFKGINKNNYINYKRDKNMLGGCITFLNSKIKNINIESKDALCPKALEVLNSNIIFEGLNIYNAATDGFDAEFSNVSIKNSTINKTNGECIGVKKGKYFFSNLDLQNCYDKAISIGEFSTAKLKNLYINTATYGIVSKDSSKIDVSDFEILNASYCMAAYKGKFNYGGSKILAKNYSLKNCKEEKMKIDNFSTFKINNE